MATDRRAEQSGRVRAVGTALLPVCDAKGCTNLADWWLAATQVGLCGEHFPFDATWEWIGE